MANSTEVNYQLKSSERSLYNDSSLMKCQQRLTKLPESAQEQNKYLGKVISSSCIFEEGLNWEDEEDLLLVRPSYTAECNTRHTSGNSRLGTKVKTHATMFFPVKKKVMCNEKGLWREFKESEENHIPKISPADLEAKKAVKERHAKIYQIEYEQRQNAFFRSLLQKGKQKFYTDSKPSTKSTYVPNKSRKESSKLADSCRLIYHHRLRHKIGPQHPEYLNIVSKRRKVNPHVWMHKRSCAVYPKKQLIQIEKKENDEERKYCRLKLIQEMSAKAPRLLNNKVLQYLSTDWEEDEKKKLPETLEPMNEWVCLQEKLLRLRYIVHNWEIGPETEFDDKWARRAMLSFSGDELKEAISSHSDWGGLTDVLRATIGLCKSKNRRFDHKLWVEHNVSEMADKLSSMNISGVNFGAFKDDLSYDQAPESVKLQLLKLVGCKVKQKKSYWERGVHHAYVNFTWPEGQNMGNYHIIFDVTTCEVLQK